MGEALEQARSVGDVDDGEEAHHGVEGGLRGEAG
jgi:hypothetical protein